jgi:hypothetical protein
LYRLPVNSHDNVAVPLAGSQTGAIRRAAGHDCYQQSAPLVSRQPARHC